MTADTDASCTVPWCTAATVPGATRCLQHAAPDDVVACVWCGAGTQPGMRHRCDTDSRTAPTTMVR